MSDPKKPTTTAEAPAAETSERLVLDGAAPVVERLNLEAPPPGYEVWHDDGDREEDGYDADCVGWYFTDSPAGVTGVPDVIYPGDGVPLASRELAVAGAWAHHQKQHEHAAAQKGGARG